MADTAKRLVGPVALTTVSTTVLYTVPSVTTTILRHIRVCNTSANPIVFYLTIGAVGSGTALYYGLSVPANDTFAWSGFEVMTATEQLRGYASVSGLAITVSGVESV